MRRDRQASERKILVAAMELFATEGPARFGVNPVARAAGIDKVLIYRYFGDAGALLLAIAQEPALFPDYATIRAQLKSHGGDFAPLHVLEAVADVLRGHSSGRRALLVAGGESLEAPWHRALCLRVAELFEMLIVRGWLPRGDPSLYAGLCAQALCREPHRPGRALAELTALSAGLTVPLASASKPERTTESELPVELL